MAPCTWHAIKIPSGLMQPYEDVEDTLPWILNDVVDFEGCFERKIIKIYMVHNWSGKKFEILGHTYGLCGGHPIKWKKKYMQLFGKVWPLKW